MVLVHNYSTKENEWLEGEIISYTSGDCGEDFQRVDVKTNQRCYEACHPDCVRVVD